LTLRAIETYVDAVLIIIGTKLANKMSSEAKMDPPRRDGRYGWFAPSTASASSVRRIGKKISTISTLVGTAASWFSTTVPSISHDRISEFPKAPAPGNQSLTSIFENQHSGFYESKLKFYYNIVKRISTADVK
jgi:hypothetical protein